METDTWIERTIIQRLSTHDRRYKHDYGGLEADTDELVMACGYLKSLDEDDARPGMMETLQHEREIEETLISINRNTDFAGDSIAANNGQGVSSGLPSAA